MSLEELPLARLRCPIFGGEIQHYLRDKSQTIRIPRKWTSLIHLSNKLSAQLRQELGRTATSEELREAMDLSPEVWKDFQVARQNMTTISLDVPLNHREESGNCLGDTIPDDSYQSFQLAQEDLMRLHQAMSYLDERTRQILELVFLCDFSQKETAARLNISAVTVSRKIKQGIRTLTKLC